MKRSVMQNLARPVYQCRTPSWALMGIVCVAILLIFVTPYQILAASKRLENGRK